MQVYVTAPCNPGPNHNAPDPNVNPPDPNLDTPDPNHNTLDPNLNPPDPNLGVQGALQHFGVLCEAFTSWRRFVDTGLHNEMAQVMQLYKQSLAAAGQWDAATASLPPPIKEKLQQSFAV